MINEVIKRVQYLLPNVEVMQQEVPKNNDIILTGVMLKSKENNIAPVFYIDEMIEKGWSADEIAIYICRSYFQEDSSDYTDSIDRIKDYEQVKDLLTIILVNQKLNEKLWEDIPYVPFLDLAVIVIINLEEQVRMRATCKITNQILEYWGVSFEEVYQIAYSNFLKERLKVVTMKEMLESLGCDDTDDILEGLIPMYIITNQTSVNGATMMLRLDIFQSLAKSFGTDLAVIPSSLHEIIVVPCRGFNLSDLTMNEIIQAVNKEQVEDTDVLSDHVYLYRKDVGWYNNY